MKNKEKDIVKIVKGDTVKSLNNPFNFQYKVVKANKNTCWVVVVINGETAIYKGVSYKILEKI